MNIDALAAIAPPVAPSLDTPVRALAGITPAAMEASTAAAAPSAFERLLSDGLQRTDRLLLDTQVDMQRLAAGDVASLHQLMARIEESRIAFQVLLQVRNRLLESYQELARMQV